jgi:hypothetical protein
MVARPLGLSLEAAAWGVHRVADATMARALRAVSTERGRDPRELSRSSPSAATVRCTRRRWRGCSTSAGSWCLRRPACSARSGCCFRRSSTTTCARRNCGWKASTAPCWTPRSARWWPKAPRRCATRASRSEEHRFERLIDLRYVGANSELTLPFPDSATCRPRCARRSTTRTCSAVRLSLGRGIGRDHERAGDRAGLQPFDADPGAPVVLARPPPVGDAARAPSTSAPKRGRCRRRSWPATDLSERVARGPAADRGIRQHDGRAARRRGPGHHRVAWDTIEIELE